MKFKEAVELIWENRRYDTSSETEAISHLNEEVAESLKALLKGNREKALHELEDALSCLFIAFKVLNVDPEQVIWRQINRMKSQPTRTMHIYSNRVEIRVGDETRGGWAIWTEDDLKDAQNMAKEFKCKIIREEDQSVYQQSLFENPEQVVNQ